MDCLDGDDLVENLGRSVRLGDEHVLAGGLRRKSTPMSVGLSAVLT
jgi:hypothetical protein